MTFFKKKAIIVDIDDTIINTHLLNKKISGSKDFLYDIQKKDIRILYVTARTDPQKTVKKLQRHDFPLPNNDTVQLFSRKSYLQSSVRFKDSELKEIQKKYNIIGTFENDGEIIQKYTKRIGNIPHFALTTKDSCDTILNKVKKRENVICISNFDQYKSNIYPRLNK